MGGRARMSDMSRLVSAGITCWLLIVTGISAPTEAAGSHAFEVLRTTNQLYKGTNFFAIEARLPVDGLSASANWCSDYQNMCEGFGLRPTGCGEEYAVSGALNSQVGYVGCAEDYNSDPYHSSALGCPPAEDVREVAKLAFSTRKYQHRCFAFYHCVDQDNYCRRNISNSMWSLDSTQAARLAPRDGDKTVYTVCIGSPAHDNGGCQHFWDGQNRCLCPLGFDLMADGRSCEAGDHAFEVLRTEDGEFNGLDFLFIEARLPADGLSAFTTWCEDYMYMCAEFGLRPTGAGEDNAVDTGQYVSENAKRCVTEYNSDPYIDNAFRTLPNTDIAALASSVFSVSATDENSFGFQSCNYDHCKRNIYQSQGSLYKTSGAYDVDGNGNRIVYTVCRGREGKYLNSLHK
ncbi:uncharacterized protein LOC144914329 [Branchiostoma floridae x Branchiostoma belcheri]